MGGAFRRDHNGWLPFVAAPASHAAVSGSLMLTENSLFHRISSLLRRKFSLFDRLGNSIKKGNDCEWLGVINQSRKRFESRKFPVFSLGIRESPGGE
jgi:hypothetical protein